MIDVNHSAELNHGSANHGSANHGSANHGSANHGSANHGSANHGSDRNASSFSLPITGTAPVSIALGAPAPGPWRLRLWPWQRQGMDIWRARREQGLCDATAVACTGAGKTTLALCIAHHELQTGRCRFLVIVVPTVQLKTQWARAAQWAGLTLTACWRGGAARLPDGIMALS